jgi:plasmid stabilization system protein ParE
MRPVVFRPEAEDEALEAREWYETRRQGLGKEFALSIDRLIDRIAGNPFAFPLVHNDTRRAILSRFPYALYFRLAGNVIIVQAVHSRQHPENWRARS